MNSPDWQPSASGARLKLRAGLLARTRAFFAARQVMEVDTPILVNAPVSDPHLHSVSVDITGGRHIRGDTPALLFVHTSPEYAMKRLLAAGVGDIYQICHVARGFEQSRLHNTEFTLVEWYRLGFDLAGLMDEVEALVRELCADLPALQRPAERTAYRDAFRQHTGLDPLEATLAELLAVVAPLGYRPSGQTPARDELLDLIMGALVGPKLGQQVLTFIYGYPRLAGSARTPESGRSPDRRSLRAVSARRGACQWFLRAGRRDRAARALHAGSCRTHASLPAGPSAR